MHIPRKLLGRRVFVRALGGAVCGAWVPLGGCELQRGSSAPAAGATAERPSDAGAQTCPGFLTPVAEHFQQFGARSHIEGWQMPSLSPDATLQIGGLVATELTVTLAELESAEQQQRVVKTMVCVFGLASTALWTGVPLRALLERAGVDRARARRARFFGRDGFENNLPLSAIFASTAPFEPLIAHRMYDQPLSPEHGFPFRLLLADRYGYKNIKWLERIELTDSDEPTGHYQTRGYSDVGLIEPQVATQGLRVRETLAVGPAELCGFAVSGYAGVTAVEISVDEGTAQLAELTHASQLPELAGLPGVERSDLPAVWSAWRCALQVRAGEQRVQIRARDASGRQADATELQIVGQG